jgi:hypothetical protein
VRRRFLLLLGLAACNRVFGIENTGVLPSQDAAVAPDGDPRIDLDLDGIKDVEDPCIAPDTDLMVDTDADGTTNATDSCVLVAATSIDGDGDGIGDGCDPTPATPGDRVRCVMGFTDPELDVAMWHPRDESKAWTLYYPRSLSVNGTGSIIADWSFESPNVTTMQVSGSFYTSGIAQTARFEVLARAARTPDPTDVGCALGISELGGYTLSTSDGTSAAVGPPRSTNVPAKFTLSVTLVPRAVDGRTLRCRAVLDDNPPAFVEQAAALPVGTLAIGAKGFASVHGIVVYERDDAPP